MKFPDNIKIPYRHYIAACAFFFAEHILGPKYFAQLFGRRKARFHDKCLNILKSRGTKGKRLAIPEESGDFSRRDFLKKYFYTAEPMIFRGVARDWPCHNWDFDFFAENFGETEAVLIDHRGLIEVDVEQPHEVTNLREYVRHVKNGGRKYLKFSPLLKNHPELNPDFGGPWLKAMRNRTALREEAQLFLGPNDSMTPIHCALECNLFVQIYGRKKWYIFPARAHPLIGPPAARHPYFYSDADPEKSENPKYPLFGYADYYEFVLEPGDVLWNPPFMWHHIRNLTETIGIGYRYNSFRAAFRSTKFLTLMRFLATRPSVFETLYYSVAKTNFLFNAAEKPAKN